MSKPPRLGSVFRLSKLSGEKHPNDWPRSEGLGVEAIRSQNFQLQMLRVSRESKVEHQIIYATAMIEPELDDEAYTVGAFSTSDDKTVGIKVN